MKLNASVQTGRTHPQVCNRSLITILLAVLALMSMTSCADFNEYQRWVTYHEAQRQGYYGGYNGQYAPGYLASRQPARQPSYQRPPVATQTAQRAVAQKSKLPVTKKSRVPVTKKTTSWDYYSRLDTRTTATFPNGLYWVIDKWNQVTYYGPDEYKRFKVSAQKSGKKIYEHPPYHGQLAGVPPPPR